MYRTLDAPKIIDTIATLQTRIGERFPDSGLCRVSGELLAASRESQKRCAWIQKPQILLRAGVGFVIAVIAVGLVETLLAMDFGQMKMGLGDFVQILEAGMNATVLIGASILFLITVETRIKRARALKAVNELRVLAQVIDMHQLTKDPERVLGAWTSTAHSPKQTMSAFELIRYLDYCSEMLSLCAKVAALYGQSFPDDVVLNSVNDLETLTTGLSRKIWQKIMILHRFEGVSPIQG